MSLQSISVEGGEIAIPPANVDVVRAFKGIPFAAPPIGELRWRPPRPVRPWNGVRSSSEYGPNSLQGVVFDDIDPSIPGFSEDCLYLNVWTLAAAGEAVRLPVLFWIHGGGFVVGSGSEPRYDGARLAAKGIVVVTVNHRLNALGYLAHPELTAESGGSMAVSALMASPLAKGLFARAIGESGAMFASPSHAPSSLAEAEERGEAFARDVGARSLAELRAAPAEAILAAAPGLGFRPIVNGQFLPRPPAVIFARGEQSDVPLLAGWTKDEGFNFTLLQGENADRRYPDLVREMFGDRAEACLALYPSGSPEIDRARARRRSHDHPWYVGVDRGAEGDGTGRHLPFPVRPRAADARWLVRREAQQGRRRVSLLRNSLCLRQSPRSSLALCA